MRESLFLNLLIISIAIFTLSYYGYPSNYSIENRAAIGQLSNDKTQDSTNSSLQVAQQTPAKTMGVKIDYPIANQEVPVGTLNISGSSTDTAAEDCVVFVDVDDIKPFQNATATGPGGKNDYSNWTFAYTEKYRMITEGNNELTAKLTCNGNNLANNNGTSNMSNEKSKWYSVNVTGIAVQAPVKNDQNQIQNQTQPASSILRQKIAAWNDKKLTTPPEESPKPINEVTPETESSTEVIEDEEETLDNFSPQNEPKEEGVHDAESIFPSNSITEDWVSSNDDLTAGAPEGIIRQPSQTYNFPNEDQVGTQVMDGGEDFNDIKHENEESLPMQDGHESQLQADQEEQTESPQSTQTYVLSDEDQVGTQVMDGGEDFSDIKHENEESLPMQDGHESQLQADQEEQTESSVETYELPNGDELGIQLTGNEEDFNDIKSEDEESLPLQDEVETKFQQPLQFFDSDDPEEGSEVDD